MNPAKTANFLRNFLSDRWILIVEPSNHYRNSLKAFFSNLKVANVRFVNTTKEARREMLTLEVGLFIVEWGLHGVNGLQFCRDLRLDPKFRQIPFLLTTVENYKSDVILASEVGIDGYLLKPFSYDDFVDALNLLLQSRSQPEELSLNSVLDQIAKKLSLKSYLDAEKDLAKIMVAFPTSARAHLLRARLLLGREGLHASDAEASLLKAIEVNADYLEAYKELLSLYQERKDLKKVGELARQLHEMSPDNPRYTLLLAKTFLDLKLYQDAEVFFKKTIRLSPKMAAAYKGLGRINLIQDDYLSAMKNFGKALDLDQDDVSVLNSLGMTYVRLGKFPEGIDKYRIALRLRPHDPRILFNLAFAQEKNGSIEQAIQYYKLALAQRPGFKKAERRLEVLERQIAS